MHFKEDPRALIAEREQTQGYASNPLTGKCFHELLHPVSIISDVYDYPTYYDLCDVLAFYHVHGFGYGYIKVPGQNGRYIWLDDIEPVTWPGFESNAAYVQGAIDAEKARIPPYDYNHPLPFDTNNDPIQYSNHLARRFVNEVVPRCPEDTVFTPDALYNKLKELVPPIPSEDRNSLIYELIRRKRGDKPYEEGRQMIEDAISQLRGCNYRNLNAKVLMDYVYPHHYLQPPTLYIVNPSIASRERVHRHMKEANTHMAAENRKNGAPPPRPPSKPDWMKLEEELGMGPNARRNAWL